MASRCAFDKEFRIPSLSPPFLIFPPHQESFFTLILSRGEERRETIPRNSGELPVTFPMGGGR